MPNISIAVPERLYNALRLRAALDERPISWTLQRILREALDEPETGVPAEDIRRSL